VGPINLAFWIGGILLIALGYTRARRPWTRYQALKEEDRNAERYEAWRGGTRSNDKSGASVAMEILRRQAQREALIAVLGFVLVFVGFAIPVR
jgi:hypothetical protein